MPSGQIIYGRVVVGIMKEKHSSQKGNNNRCLSSLERGAADRKRVING